MELKFLLAAMAMIFFASYALCLYTLRELAEQVESLSADVLVTRLKLERVKARMKRAEDIL